MQRGSATTGLIVEASYVIQEMMGVLSDPEHGAAMRIVGTSTRRVTSWITRATILMSEFVIVSLRVFNKTKSVMMSGGQG